MKRTIDERLGEIEELVQQMVEHNATAVQQARARHQSVQGQYDRIQARLTTVTGKVEQVIQRLRELEEEL